MRNPDEHLQEPVGWFYPALGLLLFLGFFAPLGIAPLFDVDEGAFSEATREMLASGNYLTTHLNGVPRFDKPILIYWLQAASVSAFGLNEFALRLPSALASTGWALLIFFFTRTFLDLRRAFIATVVMILSLQVTIVGKAAIADALLNCMLALSMFSIFRYYRERKNAHVLTAFAAIGLGTLAKGPVAILVPLAVSFIFFALRHELRSWLRAILNPAGIGVFALITLPWYTLEYLDQGQAFIDGFFLKHNIGRFSSAMERHKGPLWYYIPVLIVGLLPSTALLVPMFRHIRKLATDPLNAYLLVWAGFVFVFFSLSGTKLPHYIIYGYTPLFILAARSFDRLRHPVLLMLPPALFLLLLAAAPLIIEPISKNATDPYLTALFSGAIRLMRESGHSLILASAAAAMLMAAFLPGLDTIKRFVVAGTLFLSAINFHMMPLAGRLMQSPVKEAGLLVREKGYDVVMWKIDKPSFLVYSEALSPKREPLPGEIVLTSVKYLERLPDPVVIYEKHGIVLVKLGPRNAE
ncbi:phospholipid carrier-dependent glycosyltransferase [Prosthecochloris sp. GSB1]|uniref:ArnT family glycosyltransferase n=1 Tax=Prosthecochloris sp. GSB1 TaxID=281093 RepID=UPI000B8C75AB|nr:glycosyltransferase family 39 protein [Prosthecochloris sp. GSB1]ASQ90891.1 phospholipid carrier-dependent glycosyltransferase [Prosthecochloris sp. GSB1]